MKKAGLIGCGYMGTMHANCYKALGDKVQVVAVADLRAENKRLMEQIAKMQKDNVDTDVHKEEKTTSLSDIIRTYM